MKGGDTYFILLLKQLNISVFFFNQCVTGVGTRKEFRREGDGPGPIQLEALQGRYLYMMSTCFLTVSISEGILS